VPEKKSSSNGIKMSNALLIVKFKDGHKLYGQYQGTSDTWYPNLFDTPNEAWSLNRRKEEEYQKLIEDRKALNPEEVEIYTDYGGKEWKICDGIADRNTKRITSDCYPNWN
jgi:hypothetical protein